MVRIWIIGITLALALAMPATAQQRTVPQILERLHALCDQDYKPACITSDLRAWPHRTRQFICSRALRWQLSSDSRCESYYKMIETNRDYRIAYGLTAPLFCAWIRARSHQDQQANWPINLDLEPALVPVRAQPG
jgi:hypothetical protein